jgi:biotin carboxyl carrier protein
VKYFVTVDGEETELSVDASAVHVGGETLEAHLAEVEGSPIRLLRIDDRVYRVIARLGAIKGAYTLSIDGWRFDVEALDERTRTIRQMSGIAAGPTGAKPLVAPMPGLVVRVQVQPGDRVETGQGLVVMEAMKMENELRSTAAGTVKAVHAEPGKAVEKGTVLVELE